MIKYIATMIISREDKDPPFVMEVRNTLTEERKAGTTNINLQEMIMSMNRFISRTEPPPTTYYHHLLEVSRSMLNSILQENLKPWGDSVDEVVTSLWEEFIA